MDCGLTGCGKRFLGEVGANSLSEGFEKQPSGLKRLRERVAVANRERSSAAKAGSVPNEIPTG